MAGFFILLIILLILFALPIALSLGMIGLLSYIVGGHNLINFHGQMTDGLVSFVILAVPLFILTGEILASGAVAKRMIDFASALVGWIAGGLAHANIVTSMLFANVSGSAVADAASVGSILIPEMEKRGFSKEFSVVVTSYSASIGILIPPSIGMILYAVVSDVSIARLFAAGYLPGVGYGVCLMAVSYVIAKKRAYPTHEPFSVGNVAHRFNRTWIALLIPATIIFGIVGGAFTPTEAAAITTALAIVAATLVYRGMRIRDLPRSFIIAARRAANVLLLLSISSVFSHYLITEGIPQAMAETIMSWGLTPWQVTLVIITFLVISGIFLHGAPMILMLVPIFLPLVDQIGMDRVHFGLLFIFCVVIGEQTPPVASVLLTTCGV
ncbi:MAG: TRAP transporter large permease, partial [Rhodospirillaceae bacterium]|nr:TRAP transporter large permease [Rhodospirillaceae bacterium]